jgi:hypothetical protein
MALIELFHFKFLNMTDHHPGWSSGCMLNSGPKGSGFNPDPGGGGVLDFYGH